MNKKLKLSKKFPTFLLIGLILLIIIILAIYYLFLYYAPQTIIPYTGYAIEPKIMSANLQNQSIEQVDRVIEMVEVKENETLFKKLNSYYIGENKKRILDINYPIYVQGNSAICNISKDTKLITVNYEIVEGYPGFTITDGIMFNGDDLTRADSNEYLFLKSKENIFTSTKEIEIKTSNNQYKIPTYSNIYFAEDRIAYYEVSNGIMQYHNIGDIDANSTVTINNNTFTYNEFLIKMQIKQEEKQQEIKNEEEKTEETKIEDNKEKNDNKEQEKEQDKETNTEVKYQKPEVSVSGFDTKVYTTTTTLTINDPSGAITKPPLLEFRKQGKIFKRVQLSQTGTVQISGLEPNTEFDIKGINYYKDEEGIDREETFVETTIHTQNIDVLGTINLKYENGEIYSNKIELKNFEITNDKQDEVLRGISKIELIVNGNTYRMPIAQVNQMLKGEKIIYQTEETVKSNSNIKYEIHIYDKYGNELKSQNNEGQTRTSKKPPSAVIKLKDQNVAEVKIGLTLNNEDSVKINNYRYAVYNMKDEEVSRGGLSTWQTEISLTDLDPNDYYNIKIFGDYDVNDGKGTNKDILLGEGKFTTLSISSLGYVKLNLEVTNLEAYKASLKISIDDELTDKRLINMLSYFEVSLVPVQEESDQDELDKETKTISLNYEQLQKLKRIEEITLDFDYLTSKTKYEIQIIVKGQQGTVEQEVEKIYEVKELTTLKKPAEVQIRNQFVTGNMIDFDIRVEDIDQAILTNKAIIEVRNPKEELISREEIETNKEYERKTYNKLEKNKIYYIRIYAEQYNEGSTDETYKNNYLLKELQIYTEVGITGKLDLVNLSKKGTGKNLVNVASNNNWYVYPNFNTADYYGKEYNEETKELKLGGKLNYRRCVYDLREYAGQTVTISFKIKYVDENKKGTIYIQNAKTDKNRTQIDGITSEYTAKTYTMQIDESGYLGFYIAGGEGVYIKELQIELGTRKTAYEEFQYKMNVELMINLEDKKQEIPTKDYYIRIYENDTQILEERYEEINEENKVVDSIKNYDIKENTNYKVELLIKIRDRFYVLDTKSFETSNGREIKGIFNKQDFLEIQPYGDYIVLNDIDLSGERYAYGQWDFRLAFCGTLNFNGNALIRDASNNAPVLVCIGKTGVIENIVVNVKINNTLEFSGYHAFFGNNYGIIRNLQLNVVECSKKANANINLLGDSNKGIIEKFAINFEVPIYGAYSISSIATNYGTIKNGYIYGENMQAIFDKPKDNTRYFTPLVRICYHNSKLYNVYSLVNVEFDNTSDTTEVVSNLVNTLNNNSSVENVYSVGIGSINKFNNGPNIYYGNSNISNNYYFSDEIFTNSYHKKTTPLALHDETFQAQLLNGENAFNIDELVSSGYFPQVAMSDIMPRQEYISLPEVKDSDLPDILSTEVIEQGTNTVKVKFSVNNPAGEEISRIVIENINVRILSQTYLDKKSEVIAELYDPVKYISNYNLQSITTRGAFNLPYTREFKQGERVIEVDLYKEINSVQDWKDINTSPTENYMLMTDLDFINEGSTIRITNTYTGKLNGNHHTIKNIVLESKFLFSNMNGTLEKLYVENLKYAGLIDNSSGGIMNEIHLKDVLYEADKISSRQVWSIGRSSYK